MKPLLKAPGTQRLKLDFDILLSTYGFNVSLRRYTKVLLGAEAGGLGQAFRQAEAYTRSFFSST